MPSVILTNVQMTELFGVSDYGFVNASPIEGADTGKVSERILQAISDVPKAILKDYSTAIETQKNYLRQQQIFFYGIAVILLVISYHLFLRRVMDYYMAHVVQFLHFTAEIPQGIVIMIMVLNLLIAAMAVVAPAGKILKSHIVEEIESFLYTLNRSRD